MKYFKLSTTIVLSLLVGQLYAQGNFKKVKFLPGYSQAIESGTITGYEYLDYKLEVGPGQTLTATLDTRSDATSFNVYPPNSPDSAMFSGAAGGKMFQASLAERGEYTIRVLQTKAAAAKNESADYTLRLKLTGGVVANDTLVAGTPYHATGNVQAAIGNKPMGTETAKFGVKRRGLNEAELHLTLRGKQRRMAYSQGRFICQLPKGCLVTAERQGVDSWHVIVNRTEHYLIPDTILNGR